MPSGLAMAAACAMSAANGKEGKAAPMKPLDVLMLAPGHRPVERHDIREAPLARLWLEADPQAWLAERAPRIRAIMSSGPQAPVDADLMRRFPRLEIVASFGVGYDHVDARSAAERGDHRHPYARRARRRSGRYRHGPRRSWPCAACRRPSGFCARADGWRSRFPLLRRCAAGQWGFSASGGSARRSPSGPRASDSKVVYHGRRAQADVPYRFHASLIEWPRLATS